jgi:hypothetical protein
MIPASHVEGAIRLMIILLGTANIMSQSELEASKGVLVGLMLTLEQNIWHEEDEKRNVIRVACFHAKLFNLQHSWASSAITGYS